MAVDYMKPEHRFMGSKKKTDVSVMSKMCGR